MDGSQNELNQLAKEYAKRYLDAQVVVILPMLDRNTAIINRQYRKTSDAWVLELPGGKMDAGEDPEISARRELQEETGFKAQKLKLLFTARLVSGLSTKESYFYLATVLEEGIPKREPDELVETQKIDFDKLLQMVQNSEIADTKSISCILYYNHFQR